MEPSLTEQLSTLNEQLMQAAQAFAEDAGTLGELLAQMARDVERAQRERLEIFPVCHHSPASALHMLMRLQAKPPRAIYIELCEDMLPVVENLKDCTLPVALQAFAGESDTLPADALPVTVVAPLTEASAEYQAIAYALQHPDVHLVFVDRAVDYVFQWDRHWQQPKDDDAIPDDPDDPREDADLHGDAVAVTVGDLRPTFEAFLDFLLRNSNTRHFTEWWDQYVERTVIGADYATYRQVLFLIGSLMRHLGRRPEDQESDRLRERYMWTRIKQHMREHNIAPDDAIHICGAAHSASDVEEFGLDSGVEWQIPPLSSTKWLFGLIPSSFAAIERQFGHPAGTVSLAEATWEKSLRALNLKAYNLKKPVGKPVKLKPISAPTVPLAQFLTGAPEFVLVDQEQLLDWCVNVVALARKNGYLASTADSIAIYQTAMLLANMRNRQHPTAYDFTDAAITCLEKNRTPKKRNIAQICQILLGGDRVGTVGYASLPPLAQNIYDRLAPLGVNLLAKTNQRALLDIKAKPELLACSELLWKLNYLLGNHVVEPIMGEKKLGFVPLQESWDVRIGKAQGAVIQLGYEGVTLEQVMEQRMKRKAFDEKATAGSALEVAEAALLYMNSPRLVRELGAQATHLLAQEANTEEAPDIFTRARRLVHYYRTTRDGLPEWIKQFVATGYAHYAALLPKAFGDQGTTPEQIGGMLSFIFTLESLALALGCRREQLVLGVQGAAREQVPPDKIGLLWTTEWLLGMRTVGEMRDFFADVLDDALRLPVLPQYLNGFILALNFAPGIARFAVELLSGVFGRLHDKALIGWMPGLVLQLRQHQTILQPLIKEASAVFPMSLAGFMGWQPSWLDLNKPTRTPSAQPTASLTDDEAAARALLFAAPQSADALAAWIGESATTWTVGMPSATSDLNPDESAARAMVQNGPTLEAVAEVLG